MTHDASTPDPAPRDPASLAEQIVELSALTGGLAHEIRNPLSTLKVNLQLLDEDWRKIESADADPAARDVARRSRARVKTLLKEADRLEQILHDFLQYIGRKDLKRVPHDLRAVVADLAEFFRPQARACGVDLRVELCDDPLVCSVDANHLKQALLNLLLNAQQAMPRGGTLTLRAAPADDASARIDVIDTGDGIPTDQHEQIFQAYYSTRKGGSGLGLATTRRIIREHGGEIRVQSVPATGTTFSVVLPKPPPETE